MLGIYVVPIFLKAVFVTWVKVKEFITIVIVIVLFETIRHYTGIPLSIMDVIVFPIVCLLIYFMKFYTSPFSDRSTGENYSPPSSAWQIFGFVLFSIVFLIIGVWVTWIGIQAPLDYFSSVKGGGHGYTLIQLGIIIALYSLWFGLRFTHRLIQLNKTST